MESREIQTLMHRLFYGDINQSDGWRNLFKNGSLDQDLFEHFLASYITEDSVLIYLDSQHSIHCQKQDAFSHVSEFLKSGAVRMSDPRFKAKILINPIGVGVGERLPIFHKEFQRD